jgi:glycosyltransferase involved in cell wall biosynthesis
VTIAYLSGSPTHDRDFEQASAGVVASLERYPQMDLLAVGDVDLDSRFTAFAARIRRVPFQQWTALPTMLCQVDVNLAPLEDNPFTACKSCVKYLEAALLGVPTIASPRPDYVRVIADGENGLLAEGPAEWQEALGKLIESAPLREELGARAERNVRCEHTTSVQATHLEAALKLFRRDA